MLATVAANDSDGAIPTTTTTETIAPNSRGVREEKRKEIMEIKLGSADDQSGEEARSGHGKFDDQGLQIGCF